MSHQAGAAAAVSAASAAQAAAAAAQQAADQAAQAAADARAAAIAAAGGHAAAGSRSQNAAGNGLAKTSISSTKSGVQVPETYSSRLAQSLPQDVFALTVQALLDGTRGWALWKILLSLLLTAGIQFGMLALLFNSSVEGTWSIPFAKVSDTDKLWLQMGMVQRQVCWLGSNAEINKSASGTAGDCMLAWPSDAGCALTNRSNIFSKAEQVEALQNLTSEFSMAQTCYRNDSAEQFAALNCSTFLEETLDPGTYQYGVGLFNNETGRNARTKPMWGGWAGGADRPFVPHAQCLLTPEETTSDVQYPFDKDPLFASLVTLLLLCVYAQAEFVNAVWLAYVAAVHIGIMPRFWMPKHVSGDSPVAFTRNSPCGLPYWIATALLLFVPLVQIATALAVLLSSMSMSYILDQNVDTYYILITYAAFVFVIAVDDLVGGLLGHQANWSSWLAVWSSKPARLSSSSSKSSSGSSNRGPDHSVCDQGAVHDGQQAPASGMAAAVKSSRHSKKKAGAGVLGWTYVGILGLFLLIEPMLLSSNICALLFSLAKINLGWGDSTPESVASVSGDRAAVFDKIQGWMLAGIAHTGWASYNSITPIDPAEDPITLIIILAVIYPVLVALFVLLWGPNCLACSSRLWKVVLLLSQAALAAWPCVLLWFGPVGWPGFFESMVGQTAARLGEPPQYNLSAKLAAQIIVFLLPLIVSWVVLFVIWPAVSTRRQKTKRQEHKLVA